MGLDRKAAAHDGGRLRRPRPPRARRTRSSWRRCSPRPARREVFSTSDPDEGDAFVAARRFAIPAVEAKGSLLLEDVGVPLPALADLVRRRREDRRASTSDDLRDRSRRRRQHPPADRLRPVRPRRGRTGPAGLRRDHGPGASGSAARSPASTASAGSSGRGSRATWGRRRWSSTDGSSTPSTRTTSSTRAPASNRAGSQRARLILKGAQRQPFCHREW